MEFFVTWSMREQIANGVKWANQTTPSSPKIADWSACRFECLGISATIYSHRIASLVLLLLFYCVCIFSNILNASREYEYCITKCEAKTFSRHIFVRLVARFNITGISYPFILFSFYFFGSILETRPKLIVDFLNSQFHFLCCHSLHVISTKLLLLLSLSCVVAWYGMGFVAFVLRAYRSQRQRRFAGEKTERARRANGRKKNRRQKQKTKKTSDFLFFFFCSFSFNKSGNIDMNRRCVRWFLFQRQQNWVRLDLWTGWSFTLYPLCVCMCVHWRISCGTTSNNDHRWRRCTDCECGVRQACDSKTLKNIVENAERMRKNIQSCYATIGILDQVI